MEAFEQLGSIEISFNKKIYFASDFHLEVSNSAQSLSREQKIVEWLEYIKSDASAIFLLGDIFDFWFEYKKAVPRGFVRFLGKIAELSDHGIPIHFFTGNHDLWMSDYFEKELNVSIHKKPAQLSIGHDKFLMGHGDGIGKGDHAFKLIKKVFESHLSSWLFARLHPNLIISLAEFWSGYSRSRNKKKDEIFKGEDEVLFRWCKAQEEKMHFDFYVFGHRHMPLEMKISERSTYFNLGSWFDKCHYLTYDGTDIILKRLSH